MLSEARSTASPSATSSGTTGLPGCASRTISHASAGPRASNRCP